MQENDEDFQQECDDWSIKGAEEKRREMEASFAADRAREAAEAAEMEVERREDDYRQKQKDELVKELIELRKTYDPLRQQIEEKEGILLHLYGWDWAEVEFDYHYEHPGYPEGATEEQMQAQDMAGEIGYDPVTIEGYRGAPEVEEPKAQETPEQWKARIKREAKKEEYDAHQRELWANSLGGNIDDLQSEETEPSDKAELKNRFQGLIKKSQGTEDSIPF